MRRYLLDTNMAGHLINKRRDVDVRVKAARLAGGRIGTCVPVLAELHYGVEFSATRDKNLQKLRMVKSSLTIWPFDEPAAEEFGRLRADLRRRGRPMQVVDIMIAAIALTLGNCTVVTADSDLSAIPQLTIENWAS